LKTSKLAFALITLLFLSITIYQQIQIINLQNLIVNRDEVKSYLMANYGVSSIDELIQKKLEEYSSRYTGNPFTTALYPGQLQAENLTFMHGYWYNPSSGQLENKTDIWAFPEQTATFIIFKDSAGNVCAKNTTSGQIEFGGAWDAGGVDGANSSAVIQSAIDADPDGKIIVAPGDYDLSVSILLTSSLDFGGSGMGVTRFTYDGSDWAFKMKNATSQTIQLQVHDFSVEAYPNQTNSLGGIQLYGAQGCILWNIKVSNFKGTNAIGIQIKAINNVADAASNRIYNYRSYNNKKALDLYGYVNYAVTDNVIVSPFISASPNSVQSYALAVNSECESNLFLGGVYNNAGTYIIFIDGRRNTFVNVRLEFSDGGAIQFGSSSQYNIFYRPNISNIAGTLVSDNGVGNKILDCDQYVTENSGTAVGLADGDWIPHGLAGVPTTVSLTCLNSTYDGVPVIVSWDKVNTNSTHIAVDIYWANRTAITDNVIAVSWDAKYQP